MQPILPYETVYGLFNAVRREAVYSEQTIAEIIGIETQEAAMAQETGADEEAFERQATRVSRTPPPSPGIGIPEAEEATKDPSKPVPTGAEDGMDDDDNNDGDVSADQHLAEVIPAVDRIQFELMKRGFYEPLPFGQKLSSQGYQRNEAEWPSDSPTQADREASPEPEDGDWRHPYGKAPPPFSS